jgi:hypothetical protein
MTDLGFPLRPGEEDVVYRYDLFHPGDDEPFHSTYERSAQTLVINLQVSLTRDDVDRIEIVRCPRLTETKS